MGGSVHVQLDVWSNGAFFSSVVSDKSKPNTWLFAFQAHQVYKSSSSSLASSKNEETNLFRLSLPLEQVMPGKMEVGSNYTHMYVYR